ncbi:hypothetical protein RFI_05596 [Reticulomyxa filosa]|uniref:Uncharacterized protein n=1 Tax=Reticulomyxa filosa TaxID=46433 RepID=X6NYZ4_RETFI|nr:hypothetical protein RFI_05596 [Reticulomyxa filosa]|eukprot:ETO31525.1 hypothetical protein RFI_05596 [Reticulomyxa filosa]
MEKRFSLANSVEINFFESKLVNLYLQSATRLKCLLLINLKFPILEYTSDNNLYELKKRHLMLIFKHIHMNWRFQKQKNFNVHDDNTNRSATFIKSNEKIFQSRNTSSKENFIQKRQHVDILKVFL